MSRYDGLIIPRSYSEYINKTDAATLQQALQLSGVLSGAVDAGDNKAVTSNAVYEALAEYINKTDAATLQQALQLSGVMDNAPTAQSTNPVKSGGIFAANAVIMASSTTLSSVAISAGAIVRVLFTADLTGSDAITGLQLTYNGNAYAVKIGKNGTLVAFVASEISSGVFKYLQAYTTLELIFDGTQFIIIGNPVVLSSLNYTIYADGQKQINRLWQGVVKDANDITDFGSYFVGNAANNTPSSTSWGVLFVFPTDNEVLQFFLGTTESTFGNLYYRLRYNNTAWTSWYYVTGTAA